MKKLTGIGSCAILLVSLTIAPFSAAEEQRVAATLGTETTQATVWRILTEEAHNKNSVHRQAAMAALSIIKSSSRALKMAEQGLNDADASVREAAAFTLGQMGSRHAAARLRHALDDESSLVRFEAAKALWAMGDHSGRSVLLDVLEGKTAPSNGAFKNGMDYASKKLHDPKGLAWTGVTRASSAFLGPFSLGLVAAEQFAKDNSAPARALSASLLGADSDPESLRELQNSLQDSNWVVRREAAKSLGQRRCESVVPDLKVLLEDHHEAVKTMAAAAIVNLSMQSAAVPKSHAACTTPSAPATVNRASTE